MRMTENGGTSETHPEAEAENWTMVVDLIQLAFREGKLAEEATWKAVVLVTKGKIDYRGIGLVEVMWKLVAEILNFRITASITYHDFLHGFRTGRGTGGLEGGGTVRDIPGPAQGVWRLGQVQVPRNTGGIWCRSPGQETATDLLKAPHHGGAGGRVLRNGLSGGERGDTGRSDSPHHI